MSVMLTHIAEVTVDWRTIDGDALGALADRFTDLVHDNLGADVLTSSELTPDRGTPRFGVAMLAAGLAPEFGTDLLYAKDGSTYISGSLFRSEVLAIVEKSLLDDQRSTVVFREEWVVQA